MPNRLTPLYSKIYYKEENYLKVRTTVFKYITPPIVKVEYVGIPMFSRFHVPNFSSRIVYVTRLTPYLIALLVLSVPYPAY